MGNAYALYALRRKRAHIAGAIEKAERAIAVQRKALAELDAVIRIFEPASNPELIPSIRPCARNLFFRNGEQMRLALKVMRETGTPMKARVIAERAILAKGIPVDDALVATKMVNWMRTALTRMERKGWVRRIITEPDAWWELVPEE